MTKRSHIIALARAQTPLDDIVRIVNSTPGSVRTTLSQARKSGELPKDQCAEYRKFLVEVDAESARRVRDAADLRDITPEALLRGVFRAIARDELFDAVLDDAENEAGEAVGLAGPQRREPLAPAPGRAGVVRITSEQRQPRRPVG